MPSRKGETASGVVLKYKPIGGGNVGRLLLEKMGWQAGQGLGKDNQGMRENPLWRHKVCKTGFRSKDEICNEVLSHQSAFDELLGNLNADLGTAIEEDGSLIDVKQISQNTEIRLSKRCVRYKKMAHAKDVSKYSMKDFEGIIGKDVTKKNLGVFSDSTEDVNPQCSQDDSLSERDANWRLSNIDLSMKSANTVENSNSLQNTEVIDQPPGEDSCLLLSAEKKKRKKKKPTNITIVPHDATITDNEKHGYTQCLNPNEEIDDAMHMKKRRKLKKKMERGNYSYDGSADMSLSSQGSLLEDHSGKSGCQTAGKEEDIDAANTEMKFSTSNPDLCSPEMKARKKGHRKNRNSHESSAEGSKQSALLKEDSVIENDFSKKAKREKRKQGYLQNYDGESSAGGDAGTKSTENCEVTSSINRYGHTNNIRKLNLQSRVVDNSEAVVEIDGGFAGSNLLKIMGYGNW